MNVLVYDGPGVSQTSLQYSLSSLRTILTPNYTVQTISPRSVKSEPWPASCALFVIPGGRDLPFVSSLKESSSRIRDYVRQGGSFLGFCAGAYFACERVEWEVGTTMEVSGDRPFGFFRGTGKGCVYPGFQYETELGAKAVSLRVKNLPGGERTCAGLYYNGGGEFVDAQRTPGSTVIAEYLDGDANGKVAGVLCEVDKGRAVLWAIHPEYPLTQEPAISAIKRFSSTQDTDRLEADRWNLMRDTLRILGLQIPRDHTQELHVLPQFLTSSAYNEYAIVLLRDSQVTSTIQDYPVARITGQADNFEIRNPDDSESLLSLLRQGQRMEDDAPKQIVVYPDGLIPPKELTPHFDISQYYADLKAQFDRTDKASEDQVRVRMGEILLYGEVVTSTQTLLDRNPALTSLLPTPLLSLATFQLAGRGRGSNIWLSPTGCLQFSLLLRVPMRILPPMKLVFVQYLAGLAVVEACNSPSVLGDLGRYVRLKWPNDVYVKPRNSGELKKVGGILVNTSFSGDTVDIVIGCGLNVLTPSPLTSITNVIPPGVQTAELSMERTAATIMATFDGMWTKFVAARGSFEPFIDLYLQKWLHSDQVVTLTTQEPHIPVRIVGITMDYGFLRTIPERSDRWSSQSETYIDLQPDGNSFDLMAGLIKTKK